MGTVFAVLIFISLLISLFVFVPGAERRWKRFVEKLKETLGKRPKIHGPVFGDRPAPKRPILPKEEYKKPETGTEDEGALIAVITAAIVAASGGAVSADRLVVRSIKRMRK